MNVTDSFLLNWCGKHKNWWVTNCPDCMVDSNEESIKQAGRQEVVKWIRENGPHYNCSECGYEQHIDDDWHEQLKEWGIKA